MIKKVAIIDDDSIFQFTTKVKLEKLKLAEEVLIFNDGEEILDFVQDTEEKDLPSILLLDINMPIVDGWDFLELYKEVPAAKQEKMTIYMLSSSINPEDVRRAEENKYVQDYITKPIRDVDLNKIFGCEPEISD
ncbi:response regulator [Bacteroidia bacterium]|nr:response regulator [Bacteroidia bacterium]MDC1395882.1 response regulator [Bacteroidia bacterium]